jgi:histidyl-tRNA synthetase
MKPNFSNQKMSKPIKDRPAYLLREFDKSLFNASYFGFTPIEAPHISHKDIECVKDCGPEAHDKSAFLRFYTEKEFANLPHPITVCFKKRDVGKKSFTHSLHIIGQHSALAEALLIRTTLSILAERGFEHLVVEINSMGDKDSISAFERELHQFVRKNSNDIEADHKKILKDDIFELLNLKLADNIKDKVPPSLASLTSSSRAHFKEMLEYLEALGVDFRLTHTLVGNKHFASHTIFNIRDTDDETLLAEGFRYTRLTKKLGFKKETPAVTVTIFDLHKKTPTKERIYKELPKPKFYLIQLGQDAKMKSLPLIELLRQNHIALYHFLGKDKIIPQLMHSESLKVPYLLVLGQKEAIDNTVTVRNVSTRAQETVKMSDLPAYLKKISL